MPRRRYRSTRQTHSVKASLCVTCLVDQFFPEVGTATVNSLRKAGVDVDFPSEQTCCGQIAFNGGFQSEAKKIAERFLDIFEGENHVVVPSGSCASMIKVYYLELFKDDPTLLERAQKLSERTHELSEFLVNIAGQQEIETSFNGKVTYHDACHLLRELGVSKEPRELIQSVEGLEFSEMVDSDRCCGFGGLFSVKYPEISEAILNEKLRNIESSGADVVVANDCGCLMHIRGAMSRKGMRQKALHIAQLLSSDNQIRS